MPPSVERPWSTQYKDDYRTRKKGYRKPPVFKKPSTTRLWANRIPLPTKISAFYGAKAYGGDYYGLQEDTDRHFDLEVTGSKLNSQITYERPQSQRNINVLGQATRVVKPEAEPVIPEPTKLRTNTPPPKNLHWSCWPEPVPKEKKRPSTSLGFYRPPKEDNNQEIVIEKSNALVGKGPPAVKDPEFYEENILDEYQIPPKEDHTMMSMKRSNTFHYEPQQNRMTSITVNEPPVRDTYTMYNQQRRSHSVSPTGHYNQSFFPYHQAGGAGAREEAVMNSFAKAMEGKQPLPNNYQYSFHKYPFTTRMSRKVPLGEEYVHQHSMFTTTTPRCTGHFIIHPDWVSERGGMKRSRSFIQASKSTNGLRY